MKILVLGAGGFLGAHVVRQLLATDHDIFAGVHRSVDGLVDPARVTFLPGDLMDLDYVRGATSGMDAVVFCAGRTWEPKLTLAEYDTHNIGITQTLFQALAGRPEVRVVFTSSTSAAAGSLEPVAFHEDSGRDQVCESQLSPYDRAKIESERIALEFAERGHNVIVLNPGMLIGPGASATAKLAHPAYVLDVCQGKGVFIENRMAIVDVRDVAAAHLSALTQGGVGRRYFLSGCNLYRSEFYAILSKLTGIPHPQRLPVTLVMLIAAIGDGLELLTGGLLKSPVHRSFARASQLHYCVDSRQATEQLEFSPRPVEATLLDMLRDYQVRGLLPDRLNFVSRLTVDEAPGLNCLHQLASRDTYARYLVPRVAKLYDACQSNHALRRALQGVVSSSRCDASSGRQRIVGNCRSERKMLEMFFEHVYFSSAEFLSEVS